MNEMEHIIVQMAENCKTSDKFMYRLKKSFKVPPDEKGDFFLQVGFILYKSSYFRLALNLWDHALEYFLENSDRAGELICYTNIGLAYYNLGEFKKAIEYHEKFLKINKYIGNRAEESTCYTHLGIVYYSLSEFKKAIEYYKKSLRIAKKAGNKIGVSMCYTNLGAAYKNLGEFRKAIKYHEKSLKIDKETGNRSGESKCYTNIGLAYYNLGEFKKAIEYYKKSLKIDKEIGEKLGESKCYSNLGLAYHSLGEFKKAIEYHEKSLKIDKEIENKTGESACYINLGITYDHLGEFKKAIKYYKKSLTIIKGTGEKIRESACYTNLGLAYHSLGEFKKAIEYHEKSLKIAKETGNRAGVSKCYTNIGLAYYNLGEFKKAIKYYKKSLKIAKETGNRAGVSKCYTNIGLAYHSLGEFRKAIEYHEKSLETNKKIGARSGESTCYTNLGLVYYSLGDLRKAIEYHEKSLKINKETGDKIGESNCYGNLGLIYNILGDLRKAIEYYKKSLTINKETGKKTGESKCYTNLGAAYYSLSEFKKTIEYCNRSLKIDKETGDKIGESFCYTNLGLAYHSLGDSKKAIKYYKKSLKIIKETGDINSERIANLNFCRIYYESEKELAYKYCKHSIELSEMIGGKLVEEEKKIIFSSQTLDAYQYMIPLCLNLKKEKEAFNYTERSKSRAFLDLLAATEVRPTAEITTELQSLLDKEEETLAKLRQIQMRHLRPAKSSVEPGETERIYNALTHIYTQIEQIDPEYVSIRRGTPLSLYDLQNTMSSQSKKTVVIEYYITENETYIFIISSKDSNFQVKTVPLSSEAFNNYLQDWKKIAISPGLDKLNDFLIEPISEYVAEGDLIYFVPYGPLHYIPLHALTLNGEPVIKNHPVAYIPSASLLQFCQNKGTGNLKTCISFGTLFEKEAEKVADLFNTHAYTGSSATVKSLETCDADIMHFACHGLFDEKDPLSSRVILHDRELTARDIFTMTLTTELVTLSACETGYNKRSPGDELIGLTRAFLYAGAPSVVVSLWPVYGPSTQKLMLEFYKHLKNGTDKATALQKAQITLMETEKYSHPFFWGPFVLVGNWK